MSHDGAAADAARPATGSSGEGAGAQGRASPRSWLSHAARDLALALGLIRSRYTDLQALCAPEIEHWRRQRIDHAAYLRHLDQLNSTRPDFFVFDVSEGKVTAREKIDPSAATLHLLQTRVPAYLEFFGHVVQSLAPELSVSFGILLEDLATGDPQFPLLSFQKASTDNLLLVPEIDSLILKFYDSPDFIDELDYAGKRAAAVFVGSTTGVDPSTGRSVTITREDVDEARTERIRAATRFQGEPHITFKLPGVVQCDGPDTEAHLRSIEFCQGGPVSWKQQFGYRLLISLDGNGATCSRVALALRSKSVLLKYASPYVLFYTRALTPFVHYLPVADDEDVVKYVAALRQAPQDWPLPFHEIPEKANGFYRQYLSRTAQHRYAAVLLNELQGLLRGQALDAVKRRIETLDSPLDIMVHVANIGDRWHWPSQRIGAPASGEVIEAFAIRSDVRDGAACDLEYQGLLQDGSVGAWLPSGTLCGARGRSMALAGFRMRLGGELARRYVLRYRASFVGGPQTPWLEQGCWCTGQDWAPLEHIEVELAPRGLRGVLRKLHAAWSRARGAD
jgi:Glycosyl transferase family 90